MLDNFEVFFFWVKMLVWRWVLLWYNIFRAHTKKSETKTWFFFNGGAVITCGTSRFFDWYGKQRLLLIFSQTAGTRDSLRWGSHTMKSYSHLMTGSFRVAGTNLPIVRVCYLTLPSSHWFSRSFLFCFRMKEGKEDKIRDEKEKKRKEERKKTRKKENKEERKQGRK